MTNTSACQEASPASGGDPALAKYAIKGCEKPAKFNLTLDLYTPIGGGSLGKAILYLSTAGQGSRSATAVVAPWLSE